MYQVENRGSSPQYSLVSGSTSGYGYWGGNYFNNSSSPSGVGVRVYASFYAGWNASMANYSTIDVQHCVWHPILYLLYKPCKFIFSATVNLGASFSVSGDGWSVGLIDLEIVIANDHAESIRSAVASAMPSGYSRKQNK